ncbi:PREDICTED: lipase 3-like [Nicrophorus vespilloides]|uniref:Lipase n=1 Tax=Nicrophorus vespilloides TaxID=110193 RepID=A0ABM1M7J2_NICVS|nr:PREDICTED: lipase 3-like [Nicrophorus vespilloides]
MKFLYCFLLLSLFLSCSNGSDSKELKSGCPKPNVFKYLNPFYLKDRVVSYVRKKFFDIEILEDLVENDGYTLENHYVETQDGFILNVHRIPFKGNKLKSVVFLQHGILGSSVDWFITGPNKSLAYYLADNGYDVWLGNARGNRLSKNHTTLDPKKDAAQFWDFSFHEIGEIDLPTMIRYVLKLTDQNDLFYIGHSQGSTAFYVMCSEHPDINQYINAHFILSPVAYMNHIYNPFLRTIAEYKISTIFTKLGKYEISPYHGFIHGFLKGTCTYGKIFCKNFILLINGNNPGQLNKTLLPKIFSYTPAGSSTKQFIHYLQEIKSGYFCQYDYGEKENLIRYGKEVPPKYNLSNSISDAFFFIGKNDWISDKVDVDRLFNEIRSNTKEIITIEDEQWTHLDFLYGVNAIDWVYSKILNFMNDYE